MFLIFVSVGCLASLFDSFISLDSESVANVVKKFIIISPSFIDAVRSLVSIVLGLNFTDL